VWDQGGEVWDGVDGDSPKPLYVYPPVGFSSSEEIVEWDQEEDDSPPTPRLDVGL
jgi:hypothetical protein